MISSSTNKIAKALAFTGIFLGMLFNHRIYFRLLGLAATAACGLVWQKPMFLIWFP
jgi:hypothetical protein